MPTRRAHKPVPLAPRHRRTWRSLWRRCTCGLTAPCPDRFAAVPVEPVPAPRRNAPRWTAPTAEVNAVGRAGRMTPAQTWRANGGRWS
ncbi:hypothetical protein KBX37_10090 [Micromonospora sp. U56]|uniref:hypothetical protein n=1 Tax=Micromonospora sp. U56 TaxID=2824900 RepID=UPI001B380F72|nr:hypothetical protein [Micromonospora sp. U56]MBQ0893440.1 hypothetical protein [Micromonospora sp. U56]